MLARTTMLLASLPLFVAAVASAEPPQTWVASWAASAHGPYPVGNPTAQPEQKFALPSAETGALDQTFRMIVRPDVWGGQARIRLSNAFGTKPVTFSLNTNSGETSAWIVAAVRFACDWKKSAATDSQSTVASHSGEQAPHGRS